MLRSDGLRFPLRSPPVVNRHIDSVKNCPVEQFPAACQSILSDPLLFETCERLDRGTWSVPLMGRFQEWIACAEKQRKEKTIAPAVLDGMHLAVLKLLAIVQTPFDFCRQRQQLNPTFGGCVTSLHSTIESASDPKAIYFALLLLLFERYSRRGVTQSNISTLAQPEFLCIIAATPGPSRSFSQAVESFSRMEGLFDAAPEASEEPKEAPPSGVEVEVPSQRLAKCIESSNKNPESALWWSRCRLLAFLLLPVRDAMEIGQSESGAAFFTVPVSTCLSLTQSPVPELQGCAADLLLFWALIGDSLGVLVNAPTATSPNSPWHSVLRQITNGPTMDFRADPNCPEPNCACCFGNRWQQKALLDAAITVINRMSPRPCTSLVALLIDLLRIRPMLAPAQILQIVSFDEQQHRHERPGTSHALDLGLIDALVGLIATLLGSKIDVTKDDRGPDFWRTPSVSFSEREVALLHLSLEFLANISSLSHHRTANPTAFLLAATSSTSRDAKAGTLCFSLHALLKPWNVKRIPAILVAAMANLLTSSIHHNVRDVVPELTEQGVYDTVLAIPNESQPEDDPVLLMCLPPLLHAFAIHNSTRPKLLEASCLPRLLDVLVQGDTFRVPLDLTQAFGHEIFDLLRTVEDLRVEVITHTIRMLGRIFESIVAGGNWEDTLQHPIVDSRSTIVRGLHNVFGFLSGASRRSTSTYHADLPPSEDLALFSQMDGGEIVKNIVKELLSKSVVPDPKVMSIFLRVVTPADFGKIWARFFEFAVRFEQDVGNLMKSKLEKADGSAQHFYPPAADMAALTQIAHLTRNLDSGRGREHLVSAKERMMFILFPTFFAIRSICEDIPALSVPPGISAFLEWMDGFVAGSETPRRGFIELGPFQTLSPEGDRDDLPFLMAQQLGRQPPALDILSYLNSIFESIHIPLSPDHMQMAWLKLNTARRLVSSPSSFGFHGSLSLVERIAELYRSIGATVALLDAKQKETLDRILEETANILRQIAEKMRPRELLRKKALTETIFLAFNLPHYGVGSFASPKFIEHNLNLAAFISIEIFSSGNYRSRENDRRGGPRGFPYSDFDDFPLSRPSVRSPLQQRDVEHIVRAGFSEPAAIAALHRNSFDPENSIQWLNSANPEEVERAVADSGAGLAKQLLDITTQCVIAFPTDNISFPAAKIFHTAASGRSTEQVVSVLLSAFLENPLKNYVVLREFATLLSQRGSLPLRSKLAEDGALCVRIAAEGEKALELIKTDSADHPDELLGLIRACVSFLCLFGTQPRPSPEDSFSRHCDHFPRGFCRAGPHCTFSHYEPPHQSASSLSGFELSVLTAVRRALTPGPLPPQPERAYEKYKVGAASEVLPVMTCMKADAATAAFRLVSKTCFKLDVVELSLGEPFPNEGEIPGFHFKEQVLLLLRQLLSSDHPNLAAVFTNMGLGEFLRKFLEVEQNNAETTRNSHRTPAHWPFFGDSAAHLSSIMMMCLDDFDASSFAMFAAMKRTILVLEASDTERTYTKDLDAELLEKIDRGASDEGHKESTEAVGAQPKEEEEAKNGVSSAAVASSPPAEDKTGGNLDDSKAHTVAVDLHEFLRELEIPRQRNPLSFLHVFKTYCTLLNDAYPGRGAVERHVYIRLLPMLRVVASPPARKECRQLAEEVLAVLVSPQFSNQSLWSVVRVVLDEIANNTYVVHAALQPQRTPVPIEKWNFVAKSSFQLLLSRATETRERSPLQQNQNGRFFQLIAMRNPARAVADAVSLLEAALHEGAYGVAERICTGIEIMASGGSKRAKVVEEISRTSLLKTLLEILDAPGNFENMAVLFRSAVALLCSITSLQADGQQTPVVHPATPEMTPGLDINRSEEPWEEQVQELAEEAAQDAREAEDHAEEEAGEEEQEEVEDELNWDMMEGASDFLDDPRERREAELGGLFDAQHARQEIEFIHHMLDLHARGGDEPPGDVLRIAVQRFREHAPILGASPGFIRVLGAPMHEEVPIEEIARSFVDVAVEGGHSVELPRAPPTPAVSPIYYREGDSSRDRRVHIPVARPPPTPHDSAPIAASITAALSGFSTAAQPDAPTAVPPALPPSSLDDQIRVLFHPPPPCLPAAPLENPDPVGPPGRAEIHVDPLLPIAELVGQDAPVTPESRPQGAPESEPQQWDGVIDPAFLNELPPEVRREILRDNFSVLVSSTQHEVNGAATFLHPLFLAAIPSELQTELLGLEQEIARAQQEAQRNEAQGIEAQGIEAQGIEAEGIEAEGGNVERPPAASDAEPSSLPQVAPSEQQQSAPGSAQCQSAGEEPSGRQAPAALEPVQGLFSEGAQGQPVASGPGVEEASNGQVAQQDSSPPAPPPRCHGAAPSDARGGSRTKRNCAASCNTAG